MVDTCSHPATATRQLVAAVAGVEGGTGPILLASSLNTRLRQQVLLLLLSNSLPQAMVLEEATVAASPLLPAAWLHATRHLLVTLGWTQVRAWCPCVLTPPQVAVLSGPGIGEQLGEELARGHICLLHRWAAGRPTDETLGEALFNLGVWSPGLLLI